MPSNLIGPGGRLYADPTPGPDAIKFREDNTSAQYYNSPDFEAHKNQVQPIPRRRNNSAPLQLEDFLPAEIITAIKDAGKITFHAVGDTGAAKVTRSQTVATVIEHESAVSDAMTADVQTVTRVLLSSFTSATSSTILAKRNTITISFMSRTAAMIGRFLQSPVITTAWFSDKDRARRRCRRWMHS